MHIGLEPRFTLYVYFLPFFRVIKTSECPAYNVPTCTVSNPAYAQITRAQDDVIYEIVD